MRRTFIIVSAGILLALSMEWRGQLLLTGYMTPAVLAQAPAGDSVPVMPIRGQADVECTEPTTRRENDMVITSIQVRNISSAPIARLTLDESWYDKSGTVVASGNGFINGLFQPNEVRTVEIQTPYDSQMASNTLNFSHVNGTVRSIRVASFAVVENMSPRGASSQAVPAEWHQPLTQQEIAFANEVIAALKSAPDFPRITKYHMEPGWPLEKQINAYEQNMEITVPVEMFRLVKIDPSMFAFLLAHEAGHAKQEEKYGESCYTAGNVQFSKFDWLRTLGDVVGAALQGSRGGGARTGLSGAGDALAVMQKQACEDNADGWAVHFMRETRGADPNGGIRLFNLLSELRWQPLTAQFTSDHSIDVVRIAHVLTLILQQH